MRPFPLIAVSLIVLLLAVPAPAQEDGPEYHVEVEHSAAEKKDAGGKLGRFITVRFKITRRRDKVVVTSIPKDEIVIEEYGVKVKELDIQQPKAQKLTVVLAIDTSGSMKINNKIKKAKEAAEAFLDKMDERVEVGMILFDHELRTVQKPTRDRAKLRKLILGMEPRGGTAYLDATVKAVQMLDGVKGRRVVVVMTDGVDMNSKHTLKQAIEEAQSAELPVYTVGIGEPGKNDPVNTVLVLDHSGSMLRPANDTDKKRKIEALKVAASRFVDLIRPGSRTTLVPFSSRVGRAEPFTNNKAVLKRRINSLKARGETLLYDATFEGLETVLASDLPGKKAVVVLTDGRDEGGGGNPGSRRSDQDVIDRAKEAKVPLYMLGLGREKEIAGEVMKRMAKATGGKYYPASSAKELLEVFENLSIELHDDGIDEPSLTQLANETGGKYKHVSKLSELQFFYESLADELQSSYRATFWSRLPSDDGTKRDIKVKVVRDGKVLSTGGDTEDQTRGLVVPEMSYGVYLVFLALLGGLLALPAAFRRNGRAA